MNIKNRERVLIDDPGVAVTLPAKTWTAILRACERRAAEAGGAPEGGTLDQAIRYLAEKTADQPAEAPLKLKGRLSGFCLMSDACSWVGEWAGYDLTVATSTAMFSKKAKWEEMSPAERAEAEEKAAAEAVAIKEQRAVADAIMAKYGDNPIPPPDEPGKPETQPDMKPKPAKSKPTSGQGSLFAKPGVTSGV
jgi:hypothetical protein